MMDPHHSFASAVRGGGLLSPPTTPPGFSDNGPASGGSSRGKAASYWYRFRKQQAQMKKMIRQQEQQFAGSMSLPQNRANHAAFSPHMQALSPVQSTSSMCSPTFSYGASPHSSPNSMMSDISAEAAFSPMAFPSPLPTTPAMQGAIAQLALELARNQAIHAAAAVPPPAPGDFYPLVNDLIAQLASLQMVYPSPAVAPQNSPSMMSAPYFTTAAAPPSLPSNASPLWPFVLPEVPARSVNQLVQENRPAPRHFPHGGSQMSPPPMPSVGELSLPPVLRHVKPSL
ncbi:hypothetical protein PAPYR_1770 [Paratrimastix pyriformis]|uniref:Uncharacterized protein n=1 Tax=Paratrimastix pyriformis TaxID=342808 RepID=A0ABQ8UUB0_9EUKA|nr:hypothetical protein PAPYR_1770 [Paratrimastix pyriformis]